MIYQVKNKNILEDQLYQLEAAGNDDLNLIVEFGAAAYSSEELKEFQQEVSRQKELVSKWEQLFFIVGFSISFWIGGAFLCAYMEWKIMSFVLLAGVPISLLAAVAGHYLLRKQYPFYKNSFLVASIISQELERRRKEDFFSEGI